MKNTTYIEYCDLVLAGGELATSPVVLGEGVREQGARGRGLPAARRQTLQGTQRLAADPLVLRVQVHCTPPHINTHTLNNPVQYMTSLILTNQTFADVDSQSIQLHIEAGEHLSHRLHYSLRAAQHGLV